jgi:chromosome segregation ATPase
MKLTAIAALVAALGAGSVGTAFAAKDLMTRDAYKAEKDRIEAEYKAAKEACNKLSGNAEDVCKAEARGNQRIAEADLDAKNSGTAKARAEARNARAEAAYAVAKEKCDDLAGNPKDVCVKEAKAAQTKAKADAKADRKVADARKDADERTAEARKDAAEAKRDADYRVAVERCDRMAGDAKDACVKDAKARFGKS